MSPTQRWFSKRLEALCAGAARGATMVEYALVLSLLVVGSLIVFEQLTEAAGNEVDNQAACVSTRPAPVGDGCNVAPAPPDIVTPDPGVVPIPPNQPPEEPAPMASAEDPIVTDEGGQWRVEWPITLMLPQPGDPPGPDVPLGGVEVIGFMRVPVPDSDPIEFEPEQNFTSCFTNGSGTCNLVFVLGNEHEAVRIAMSGVNHVPSVPSDSFPERRTLDRPDPPPGP